jgi:hypothetical protein
MHTVYRGVQNKISFHVAVGDVSFCSLLSIVLVQVKRAGMVLKLKEN